MTVLTIERAGVERSEVWPEASHYGLPVFLAGGEVGLLQEWHHSEGRSWSRWTLGFANHVGRPDDWAPANQKI